MNIRNAKFSDIETIFKLEQEIDKDYAAKKEVLIERLKMFPEGFLVVEVYGKVVGYIETCIWSKDNFSTFNDIKDFPKHHSTKGIYLYVIFIGVAEKHRKKALALP